MIPTVSRPGERWVFTPGNEWYLVSDRGRVYSLPRGKRVGRLLRIKPNDKGYCQVALWAENKRVSWHLGPLVLTAFVGPCPHGSECRHKNGKPWENDLKNLAWGTPVENDLDKDLHGTRRVKDSHPQAKLTHGLAEAIRRLASGVPATKEETAEWFGVSLYTIEAVLRGDRWDPGKPLASGRPISRPKERT